MNTLWKLAWMNLWRNYRRTLATGFTICLGYTGLVLLGGYLTFAEMAIRGLLVYVNHVGHISLFKKDAVDQFFSQPKNYTLDPSMIEEIEEILEPQRSGIEKIGYYLKGMGLLSAGERSFPVIIQGIDPLLETYVKTRPIVTRIIPGLGLRDLRDDLGRAAQENSDSVSLTPLLGKIIGKKTPFWDLPLEERELQLAGRSLRGDLNAVNVVLGPSHSTGLAFIEEVSVNAPLKKLQELLDTDGFYSVSLFLKDGVSTRDTLKALKDSVSAKKLDLDVFPYFDEKVGLFYIGNMSFLYTMGAFFFILILGVVVLSVVNTITIGIIERTREIGTLRALGFEPKAIARMFSRENFIIGLACVVLGTLLGYLIAYGINSAGFRFRPTGVANDIPFLVLPQLWICFALAIPTLILTSATAYLVSLRKTKQELINLLTDNGVSA